MPDKPTDLQQNTQEQMAVELDEVLLKTLQEGQQILDQKSGEAVTITPTASIMNVVRQRLRDLNMNADPTKNKTIQELQALADKKTVDGDFPDLPEPSDEPGELVG